MKTRSFSLLLSLLSVILFSNCGKNEDSLCGPETVEAYDVYDKYIYNDFDVVNLQRHLIYEDLNTPEDICPDEHVNANFNVKLSAANTWTEEPHVVGKAYWGLYEDTVALLYNPVFGIYYGELRDIGMKQAFGESAGWIGLQIHFTFPTQGSLTADTTYILDGIDTMFIQFQYYKFLPI